MDVFVRICDVMLWRMWMGWEFWGWGGMFWRDVLEGRWDRACLPIKRHGVQSSYASFFCVARVSEILGGWERVITEG
jgi:hypothetical protein